MNSKFIFSVFILIFAQSVVLSLQAQEQATPEEKTDQKQILLWKVPAGGSKSFIPDISLIGSLAGAYFRNDPGSDLGENPSRTGFNLQSIELGLQAVIDPYVRGDIFILFKEEGVEVEDATITTLSLPLDLQIRAGKILTRFGRQNTQHLEQLNFVDYSRVNRFFLTPEGFSELGVEVSVLFPFSWASELAFEFLQGENEGNFDGNRKEDFVYLGNFKNTFDLSPNITLQTGLSGAFGFNNTADGNLTQLYAADIYLRWRPNPNRGLKIQSEYFLCQREISGSTQVEGGIYAQIVYQFAKRWDGGIRFEKIGFPKETLSEWSFSPQITFMTTEFFRLRGQYNFINTTGAPKGHEAFLQLQFNMGAHGAHVF